MCIVLAALLLRAVPTGRVFIGVFIIARDIENNEDVSALQDWKRSVLSTTGTFKLLPTSTARYWYALQERERIATLNAVAHRSTFQRIHEISQLVKRLKETTPAAQTSRRLPLQTHTPRTF